MLLYRDESHVQGVGLVVDVLGTTSGGGGSGIEGLGFVVGLAAQDHGPDDAGPFVGAVDDPS